MPSIPQRIDIQRYSYETGDWRDDHITPREFNPLELSFDLDFQTVRLPTKTKGLLIAWGYFLEQVNKDDIVWN